MLLYCLSVIVVLISENIYLKLTFTPLASNSPDKTKFGPNETTFTVTPSFSLAALRVSLSRCELAGTVRHL